jgi:ubiquinone/menaquinone biosynthesis C-methylase UbiE
MHPPANPDVKAATAATYDAAADLFDSPVNAFWERIGRRTVERMALKRGAHMLDACCGSGASAIPAAEIVGPTGRLLGVDLSQRLLARARAKAAQRCLTNAEFRLGDIEALDPAAETFDAVICVFGIFFLPDMAAGSRHLWQLVRPGGQLAITTWGGRVFEPGRSAILQAVRKERPDLYKASSPWDLISEPAALASVLREGGVPSDEVVAESGSQALDSPEDFWTVAMGSGYRGTLEQMDAATRERVRQTTIDALTRQNVRSIETNAIYALARKS